MAKSKKETFHTALWNVAAVASIVAVICKTQTYVIGSTVAVTIYHVVMFFVDDDLI